MSINSVKIKDFYFIPKEDRKSKGGPSSRFKTRITFRDLPDEQFRVYAKALKTYTEKPNIRNPFTRMRFVPLKVQEEGGKEVWVLVNKKSLSQKLGMKKEDWKSDNLERTINEKIDTLKRKSNPLGE